MKTFLKSAMDVLLNSSMNSAIPMQIMNILKIFFGTDIGISIGLR